MSKIIITGLSNVETTLHVDDFPVPYSGTTFSFFGINTTVSGACYNTALGLATLGNDVTLLTIIGSDLNGEQVRAVLRAGPIRRPICLPLAAATPQSIILYDDDGRRQIFSDLKNVQDVVIPADQFRAEAAGRDLAVLTNANLSRPLLAEARRMGLPIATDVHAIGDLDDSYNRAYMAAADVLFMSHERLPLPPEQWVRRLWERYGAPIVVVGLGAAGALLGVRADNYLERLPAVAVRPVVNTVGAGDALFAGFLHAYAAGASPEEALQTAQIVAGHKIGASGGAVGLLNAEELARWQARLS